MSDLIPPTWSLGERLDPGDPGNFGADLPVQMINFAHVHTLAADGAPIPGATEDSSHGAKIEVRGADCTEVARRIVDLLNAFEATRSRKPPATAEHAIVMGLPPRQRPDGARFYRHPDKVAAGAEALRLSLLHPKHAFRVYVADAMFRNGLPVEGDQVPP